MTAPLGARAAGLVDGHPLLMCGFRPFFVLTAGSACALVMIWLLVLAGWLSAWTMPGGILLWHAHELIFGFGTASIAGFVLTAIPEFTGTTPVARRPLALLALLWLAARAAYALAGCWPSWLGAWPAALCNLALWAVLLAAVGPPVWRDPGRGHVGFVWAMGALGLLQAGFFVSLAIGADAMPWLHAGVGALMILIVIAGSRVSMSVVNGYIEAGRPGSPPVGAVVYLARPPRRYLAIFAIAVCSAVEFALGADPITGWAALAAAAAMLNLLNDWHIGRPLFTRWALMLYASYWLIALGYAAMGAAWLGAPMAVSAGRHVLTAGAMGLAIFTIMSLAGRIHAGHWLDRRVWLPLAALGLVAAVLLRAAAGLTAAAAWSPSLLWVSGTLWAGVFAVYLWHAWPVLTGPRSDGQDGCAEPLGRGPAPAHVRGGPPDQE